MVALLVEAIAASFLFAEGVDAAGMFRFCTLVGFDVLLGLGLMFLADLRKGITGGGLVTKLSALIWLELGSLFGHSLLRFFAAGLLSSSLLALFIS